VSRLVQRVAEATDRDAQDAAVDLDHGSVTPTPSHTGIAVRTKPLRKAVVRTLLDTGTRHPVMAKTDVVQPKVTTEQLAAKYPAVLILHRASFTLSL
jgi:vancomycin resistance protein YoaR